MIGFIPEMRLQTTPSTESILSKVEGLSTGTFAVY